MAVRLVFKRSRWNKDR